MPEIPRVSLSSLPPTASNTEERSGHFDQQLPPRNLELCCRRHPVSSPLTPQHTQHRSLPTRILVLGRGCKGVPEP